MRKLDDTKKLTILSCALVSAADRLDVYMMVAEDEVVRFSLPRERTSSI